MLVTFSSILQQQQQSVTAMLTVELLAARLTTVIRHTWSNSKDIPMPRETETSMEEMQSYLKELDMKDSMCILTFSGAYNDLHSRDESCHLALGTSSQV